MDELWGHYAKRNNPVTKKTYIIGFHLHEVHRSQIQRQKVKWWLIRGLGVEENGELLFNGYRVSVFQHEKVLKMDDGDGYTTVWMYLIPLNYTLKISKFCYVYFNTIKKEEITIST